MNLVSFTLEPDLNNNCDNFNLNLNPDRKKSKRKSLERFQTTNVEAKVI